MFDKKELQKIKEYLRSVSDESKIYLGCDSQKYKKKGGWYASYAIVLAVHIDGKHGCKLFGYTNKERIYDSIKTPRMRLMGEIYRVVELYNYLADELDEFANFECEIHLDVNADPKWKSNIVMKEALGYVRGMTGLDAKIKPDAWSASYAADWLVRHRE